MALKTPSKQLQTNFHHVQKRNQVKYLAKIVFNVSEITERLVWITCGLMNEVHRKYIFYAKKVRANERWT